MTFLYSILLLLILYGIAAMFYFVYYTPGTYTLYDSPIARLLFPWVKHPLFPSWGTTTSGMIQMDKTKYGAGSFWPQSGEPNQSVSCGADPAGGMRPTQLPSEPVQLRNGYDPLPSIHSIDIYEQRVDIPEKTVWPVGWWGEF